LRGSAHLDVETGFDVAAFLAVQVFHDPVDLIFEDLAVFRVERRVELAHAGQGLRQPRLLPVSHGFVVTGEPGGVGCGFPVPGDLGEFSGVEPAGAVHEQGFVIVERHRGHLGA
jgi:hypothetical protein